MKENDEKLGILLSSIQKTAREKSRIIDERIEEERSRRLKAAENELLAEAYNRIRMEVASIRTREARRVSDAYNQCRRNLYERREEIAQDVMAAVRKKIEDFTATDEYAASLEQMADKASVLLGGLCTVRMRPTDLGLFDRLAAHFSGGARCVADEDIRLGGIIVSSETGNRRIDFSYDAVFSDIRSRFASVVSFSIS